MARKGDLGKQKKISHITRKGIGGAVLDYTALFREAGELQFVKAEAVVEKAKENGKIAKIMNFDKKSRWDKAA